MQLYPNCHGLGSLEVLEHVACGGLTKGDKNSVYVAISLSGRVRLSGGEAALES